MDQIVVGARFNGPPDSGNGGYVCGLLGSHLDGPAETTLRIPPPLERPLDVRSEGGRRLLVDGDTLVAETEPAAVDVEPPAAVTLDQAEQAVAGYPGFTRHVFPTCFVCGPEREPGDGLRVFAGPVEGAPVVAAPWTPAAEFAGGDGAVRPEIVWAALDCPTAFTGLFETVAVLGRLAVDVRAPVRAEQPHVVSAWGLRSDGRKHFSAAAISTPGGAVLAVSRATWIELRR